VDRLDYTKGIDVRLRAYEELIEQGTIDPEKTTFVQIAVPTRARSGFYGQLRSEVEATVSRINGHYGSIGRPAVHYYTRQLPRAELVALYLAADVMLVTPLIDGMNLVAKEYVAARSGASGVLVLSEFAGASLELTEAIIINPYDVDALKKAIVESLRMPADKAAARMKGMYDRLVVRNVDAWAECFLSTLEQS
jgi:trehalose 6-phosphate synthase